LTLQTEKSKRNPEKRNGKMARKVSGCQAYGLEKMHLSRQTLALGKKRVAGPWRSPLFGREAGFWVVKEVKGRSGWGEAFPFVDA